MINKNLIPLHERREDVLHYIAEHHPHKTFTSRELLCLFAHHWPGNERELEDTLSDMKYRRTDKTYPSPPVREEELHKVARLAMLLADSVPLDDYINLSKGYLCNLLPLKYSSDLYGEYSPGLYVDPDHTKLSIGDKHYLIDVIKSIFANIFGQSALRSNVSILDHDTFSEEAHFTVSQNLHDYDEELLELEHLENQGLLEEQELKMHRKSLNLYIEFLRICDQMCERKETAQTTERHGESEKTHLQRQQERTVNDLWIPIEDVERNNEEQVNKEQESPTDNPTKNHRDSSPKPKSSQPQITQTDDKGKNLKTKAGIAEHISCSIGTVKNLMKERGFPYSKKGGTITAYSKEVDKYMIKRKERMQKKRQKK